MFSATKFVVAGAIVALFGGFLLAGVLTQPSGETVPAVGATASITPPASEEATSLAWERVEIPDGLDDTWVDVQSTGTHFVASSWDSPGQAFVSRDGLSWSALPIEGEVIGGYQGTLLVLDGSRLSAIRLTDDEGIVEDGLLAFESLELPYSGLGVMGSMGHATAYGPGGLVVAADDADRQTSIVWHTDDGRSWEQVYETEGEEWEEVIATTDGFVATSYREDGFTVLHSTDGREWTPLHEPGPGGYYKLVGSAPFGTVIRDLSGGDGGSRAVLVGSSDAMEALSFPTEVETRLRARTPDSWGAGGLGAVGLFIPDRLVAHSVDGTTWHPATLPGEVPLLQGYNRIGRSTPHVTQEAVLLSTRVCLEPDGAETECEDPYAEGDKPVWFRGTPTAPMTAPETPTVDDLTPDDTAITTPDLLPGVELVTEEVELGVHRVLSDGAGHDLVAEPPADVALGPDDSLWLLRTADHGPADILGISVDALFRLGQEGSHPFEPSSEFSSDLAVSTDGVVWMATGADWAGASLATFDGSESTAPTWPDGSTGVAGIEATEDGAVWVTRPVEDGRGPRVARIVDGEWTVLPVLEDPSRDFDFHASSKYFAAAADGTAWLGNGDFHGSRRKEAGPRLQGLLHFDGTSWRVVDLPLDGSGPVTDLQDPDDPWPWRAGQLALGSDGTLWVYLEPRTQGRITCSKPGRFLARLRDGEWTVFGRADGVPTLVCGQRSEAAIAVDGAGRLWVAGPEDGGVRSFDGTTWRQYLADLRSNRVQVMPDGSVVATALYGCPDGLCGRDGVSEIDWSQAGLYVITPEAMAE